MFAHIRRKGTFRGLAPVLILQMQVQGRVTQVTFATATLIVALGNLIVARSSFIVEIIFHRRLVVVVQFREVLLVGLGPIFFFLLSVVIVIISVHYSYYRLLWIITLVRLIRLILILAASF
jgi:hypothetical protein